MPGPLAGLRILEMAGLGPCPMAGQLLADLGADVIVVDRKSGKKADPTDLNNRGKRSVCLDLKKPGGLEAALRIVERADILIEGFRPGVMERLGLGPADCHARNSRLVYGRMTGWGQQGPLSHTAGHDINYLAITGALGTIGTREGPPVPPLNLAADYAGGTMFLLLGVLSALYERERSGAGQVVDAAMVDGVPALMNLIYALMARGLWRDERQSNLLDGGAPFYRCYETADGQYISVGSLEPQFFAELVEKAGIDPEHRRDQLDTTKWAGRADDYAGIFRSKTRAEWNEVFAGTDACVAPVMGLAEAADHPHNRERGNFLDIDGVMQAAPAPRFERTPAPTPGTPPAPGQHTGEVLAEIGLTQAEIEKLAESGALG